MEDWALIRRLHAEGVRMRFIGRREGIGPELNRRMDWAERETEANIARGMAPDAARRAARRIRRALAG